MFLVSDFLESKMRERSKIVVVRCVICAFFVGILSFGQEDFTKEERLLFQRFQSLNKNFEKAVVYYNKGDVRKSKKEFEKILEQMPQYADARFYMGQIAYKEGDMKTALSLIVKAKEDYAFVTKMKVGMVQMLEPKLREQREALLTKLGELEIKLPSESASNSEAVTETQIDREMEKVKQEIERIDKRLNQPIPTEEDLPADYFYIHGNIYFKMKKFQEAHDQYQETIRINPKYGRAYNNLAALYFQVKQYQKALDYISQAEANGATVNPDLKKAVLKALGKK